jgi:hypothetical protein
MPSDPTVGRQRDNRSGERPAMASPRAGQDPTRSPHDPTPFQTARVQRKRLKLFLWGDTGAGKTTKGLEFPKPVVIDLEGGTDLYGERFDFAVLRTTSCEEVNRAVDWLAANKHPYESLLLDPITVYWEALQRKWSDIFLRRNRGSKGHRQEFYDFQPKDWMAIKADWRELLRKLIALDMHVIVTARAKAQYADTGFMRAIGTTFDSEKTLPYVFDIVLHQYRDSDGRFLAEVVKDRTGQLPTGPFEPEIDIFRSLLSMQGPSTQKEA